MLTCLTTASPRDTNEGPQTLLRNLFFNFDWSIPTESRALCDVWPLLLLAMQIWDLVTNVTRRRMSQKLSYLSYRNRCYSTVSKRYLWYRNRCYSAVSKRSLCVKTGVILPFQSVLFCGRCIPERCIQNKSNKSAGNSAVTGPTFLYYSSCQHYLLIIISIKKSIRENIPWPWPWLWMIYSPNSVCFS